MKPHVFMNHIIMSWNVRGLGGAEKHPAIKDCVRRAKATVIILQETKHDEISHKLIKDIWGIPNVSWEFLPSVGASEGVS